MDAGWAAIIVGLITGPLMWFLKRLDKRNTEQHGQAVSIIKEVKENVKEVRDFQIWMDMKLDRHIEQDHGNANADNKDLSR